MYLEVKKNIFSKNRQIFLAVCVKPSIFALANPASVAQLVRAHDC